MSLVDALLPEFDHEMTVTRKVLERVPEGQFDWKPHQKSRSLGQLAQHVATIPTWGKVAMGEGSYDLANDQRPGAGPDQLPTRQDILSLFDRNVSDARAALVGRGDGEMMAQWTLKRGAHTLFTMPRASVWRSFVMNHLIHHRAQLGVYLRLHDIPLPSVYGPSADEGSL